MRKATSSNIFYAFIFTVAYLTVSFFLIGFKSDQLVLAAVFNTAFLFNSSSQKFITGFSIFIVYWIIFDYMKAFPNYNFNTVHIEDLYAAEKSLFGIHLNGRIVTLNEYWLQQHNTFFDLLAGFFYLCWIPVPLAFAAYLFFTDKKIFLQFSFTFVLVNFIGFIIYYVYPAAPPWYIQEHGNHFISGTKGNTAGLIRFDQYFNISVFENLYSKSSNVFAAMPSLHSSYPLIVLYYSVKKKMSWMLKLIFAMVMLGIWMAAVYSSHHYLLDVLAGIGCAILGIFIFEKLLLQSKIFNHFLQVYYKKISN